MIASGNLNRIMFRILLLELQKCSLESSSRSGIHICVYSKVIATGSLERLMVRTLAPECGFESCSRNVIDICVQPKTIA